MSEYIEVHAVTRPNLSADGTAAQCTSLPFAQVALKGRNTGTVIGPFFADENGYYRFEIGEVSDTWDAFAKAKDRDDATAIIWC